MRQCEFISTKLFSLLYNVFKVESYDSAAADYEEEAPLIASTCVRDLIKLAGVTLGKRLFFY